MDLSLFQQSGKHKNDNFRHHGEKIINNGYVPVSLRDSKHLKEKQFGYSRKYNVGKHFFKLGFGDDEAKLALQRLLWAAVGISEGDETNIWFQGWLAPNVKQEDRLLHKLVASLCKIKNSQGNLSIKWLNLDRGLQHTICGCLDADKDKELKKIDSRMRVECHSALCSKSVNAYYFEPTRACPKLEVCNESATAQEASLRNITLKCAATHPVAPPNTSSASESLGARPKPPPVSQPKPSQPKPSQPKPSQPKPSQPKPSQPKPSQGVSEPSTEASAEQSTKNGAGNQAAQQTAGIDTTVVLVIAALIVVGLVVYSFK